MTDIFEMRLEFKEITTLLWRMAELFKIWIRDAYKFLGSLCEVGIVNHDRSEQDFL